MSQREPSLVLAPRGRGTAEEGGGKRGEIIFFFEVWICIVNIGRIGTKRQNVQNCLGMRNLEDEQSFGPRGTIVPHAAFLKGS